MKVYREENVFEAAVRRISWCFDRYENVCLSFSGGKDSTVLMHLTCAEARRRGRRVQVLFIDWEAQYRLTIQHVERMFADYADVIEPIWVCLPLTTVNACSAFEPEWSCWDPSKADLWVRDIPECAVRDPLAFTFYEPSMTFEHFVDAFTRHLGPSTVQLLGLRSDESSARFLSICDDLKNVDGLRWTTETLPGVVKGTPIYDWSAKDVWVFHAKTGLAYNRVYDRFHQAGLSLSRMRVCEPYGNEQRKGLQLFHAIEPETWSKVAARVSGANACALYSKERGNILGDRKIELPNGHTWRSFTEFLLATMPSRTAEHYRNKIAVYIKWYREHGVDELPETADGDLKAKDVGSWRRICRAILKNDYWCSSLGFSPQKTKSYERYRKIMERRRNDWGIFANR